MLYLNYEKAVSLNDNRDILTECSVNYIQGIMLSGFKFRPLAPFDMLYFFCSAIRFLETAVERDNEAALPCSDTKNIINLPNLDKSNWKCFYFVKSGMASKYSKHLQANSLSDGTHFDAEFALAIFCRAFDEKFFELIEEVNNLPERAKDYDKFDDWLAGFNAEE